MKPFFTAREDTLKRMPAIKPADQTMGFDHVGHHPQPDLPPAAQEIPGRRAETEGTKSPMGVGIEPNRGEHLPSHREKYFRHTPPED
jgi:hypothetical protein